MRKIQKPTKTAVKPKKLNKSKATPKLVARLNSIKTPKKQAHKPSKQKPTDSHKLSVAKLLPAIIVSFVASILWTQPNIGVRQSYGYVDQDVLAYATNTTHAGLLSATNVQRSANGAGSLTLSPKLNSAAQAKANDMVNRDYWSHQTPDGKQPWVFITNTGYQYLSAGENLAYGFSNSNTTITGWMNSPSHKANLISTNYTEVGFGMADSENFVGNGQQTVVVAMYAKPQAPAPAPAPVQPVAPAPAPAQVQSQTSKKPTPTAHNSTQPTPAPTEQPATQTSETPAEQTAEIQDQEDTAEQSIQLANANYSTEENSKNIEASRSVSRIQMLTNGNAAWSATLVILLICSTGLLWTLHRGYRLTQIITNSGRAIGKNLHIDLLVLSLIFLAYVLMNTSGVIK